ncbi:MAG: hypothetical protein ND866_04925 [Pyrinomonadaceae bacterium]|nr:hypothetical protein [Pyrinomonadaceae bacterium]
MQTRLDYSKAAPGSVQAMTHERRARRRRDRAAALRPERVARGALLLRARACRAGLGGGGYADLPDPRVGRRVRGRPGAIQRGGVSQADDGHHRHQRLEPPAIAFRPEVGKYRSRGTAA